MTRRLSQRDAVLQLLSDHRWHSTLELAGEGVMRGPARIFELRCAGYPIDRRLVELPSGTRVAEYRLREPLSPASDELDPDAELERIRRKFPDLAAGA